MREADRDIGRMLFLFFTFASSRKIKRDATLFCASFEY